MSTENTQTEQASVEFKLSAVEGFERGPSIFRFEPSGIIKVDNIYHVYYTHFSSTIGWPELFKVPNHTQVWLATSKDGWHWNEVGPVLKDSAAGTWHQNGKHAPHVVQVGDLFYMFYTAHLVAEYFPKRIGLAVADSPAGPFRHIGDGPLLDADPVAAPHDAVGQDDGCVFQRGDEFWYYYKGYGGDLDAGRTINNYVSLAIADSIEGPYRRCDDNPVAMAHTACVWPQGSGVVMISDVVDTSANHRHPPCIRHSEDGIHFTRGAAIEATTTDPAIKSAMASSLKHWGVEVIDAGVYCPEICEPEQPGSSVSWGLCQLPDDVHAADPARPQCSPFLLRFDCDLKKKDAAEQAPAGDVLKAAPEE